MSALLAEGRPFRPAAGPAILSPRTLRVAISEHRVRRVLQGVYVDARVLDTRQLRAQALHLVMPPRAVLFGTTALWLLGIDAFQPEERFVLTPCCVVPHGTVGRRGAGVRTVEGDLPRSHITEIEGLRITTPARTTVDVLRRLRRPFALSAADAMAHAGHVTKDELQEQVDVLRHYPGIVQARCLVRMIEPLTESPGESWTRLRLVDAGLPFPQSQLWVVDVRGRRRARLDLAYEAFRVGCEYDGREVHGDDDRQYDEERREWVRQVLGWRICTADKASVFSREPSIELQVAAWLGVTPTLPRQW